MSTDRNQKGRRRFGMNPEGYAALSTSRFEDFPSEFMIPPLAVLDYYPPTLFISHKSPAAFYSAAFWPAVSKRESNLIRSEIGLGLGFWRLAVSHVTMSLAAVPDSTVVWFQQKEINRLFSCNLCAGYIIDAHMIVECMHSFCKSVRVKTDSSIVIARSL